MANFTKTSPLGAGLIYTDRRTGRYDAVNRGFSLFMQNLLPRQVSKNNNKLMLIKETRSTDHMSRIGV